MPAGIHHREILGVAALGGIGFTVPLFITDLAFSDAALISQAKVAILAASVVAALPGAVLLLVVAHRPGRHPPTFPTNKDRPGS